MNLCTHLWLMFYVVFWATLTALWFWRSVEDFIEKRRLYRKHALRELEYYQRLVKLRQSHKQDVQMETDQCRYYAKQAKSWFGLMSREKYKEAKRSQLRQNLEMFGEAQDFIACGLQPPPALSAETIRTLQKIGLIMNPPKSGE